MAIHWFLGKVRLWDINVGVSVLVRPHLGSYKHGNIISYKHFIPLG